MDTVRGTGLLTPTPQAFIITSLINPDTLWRLVNEFHTFLYFNIHLTFIFFFNILFVIYVLM